MVVVDHASAALRDVRHPVPVLVSPPSLSQPGGGSDRLARDARQSGVVSVTSRPPTLRRPPDPEYPDRPYVRDIYDAQLRGFPIFDGDAFEVYRMALTSPTGLTDDPEVAEVLGRLAQQARAWLEQNPDVPIRLWWAQG
jgi:hypothetical protein